MTLAEATKKHIEIREAFNTCCDHGQLAKMVELRDQLDSMMTDVAEMTPQPFIADDPAELLYNEMHTDLICMNLLIRPSA